MKSFIDKIIEYLNGKFNSDTTLSKKPIGHYAYEKDLLPNATTPFYTVQMLDNSTQSETFSEECTINAPIQINLYGVKMKVRDNLTEAQAVAYILAEMCKAFMEEYKHTQSGIVSMRCTSCTPALPYENGSKAYYSVIRYNIIINKEN